MKIIVSNSSRGAYHAVVDEMKKHLSETNIVIAPDRFTASVERGLISTLNIDSSFNVEVMSFVRLADRLLGKNIAKCLTPEGSVMLIGKVIAKKRDQLKFYGKVAMADGFASELYAALTSIRNSGISTQSLRESMQKMPPYLKLKVEDIITIYEGYLEELTDRHSDSSTRLSALAEYIKQCGESVAGINFYCTDIYDFSAPELDILSGLAKNALSLTIGVTSGYDNPNRRIYPDRMVSRLTAITEDKAEIVHVREELPAPIDAISRQLFSYALAEERAENCDKVKIRRASNIYDEVLALAMDVLKGVRNGKRYRDFEVFVSDIDEYAPIVKSVFARYDIPFFIDKKELLYEQSKVRYILSAIACVRSGMRRREILEFVKNPLFYLRVDGSEQSVFEFENYVLKYNIDRGMFAKEFTIADQKYIKSNFTSQKYIDKSGIEENTVPEQVRKQLLSTLDAITVDKADAAVFSEGCIKILSIAEEAWEKHVDMLSSVSEYYRKCAEQVDKKLADVLNEIADVLNMELDIAAFESVFKAMLKTLKIALVPTFLDCVFVGGSESRFMGQGDIYMLGCNSEKLPCSKAEGLVLNPKDEEIFAALGIAIFPDERQRAMTEKYAIVDLMKKPHGKLVLSYAELGATGPMRQSSVITELMGMLCENGKPIEPQRIDFSHLTREVDGKEMAALLLSSERSGYFEVLRNVISGKGAPEERRIYMSAFECMDPTERERLAKSFDVPVRIAIPSDSYVLRGSSVSRLEKFYACPYAHYLQYILSLKRRKEAKPEGTENGTVIHAMLEYAFRDIRDGVVTCKDDILRAAAEYFEKAIKENGFETLLQKPDTGRMLMRVKNEGTRVCGDLYEIACRSSFKPVLLEAKIGYGGIAPIVLRLRDGEILLEGYIDRADIYDDAFYVVDYKTYKSADLKLSDLYFGNRIQLYVYMTAIKNSLKLRPVGVFYLPIYSGFSGKTENRYKFRGQVTDDEEILKRIDSFVQSRPSESIVPYKMTKSGPDVNVHMSDGGFELLGKYAIDIATKGAQEIADGYIRPTPMGKACDNCAYGDICAFKGAAARKQKVASMASFEEDRHERKEK